MDGQRYLIVVADDYGIGPATSQGILDLAAQGVVTGAVLLVNSPHAEHSIKMWRRSGSDLELGWHPCLTLDRPVLPAARVPSLVTEDGHFPSLGTFLKRLILRKVRRDEVEQELAAQYWRFCELVGQPPPFVNSHHHVQVFHPVGSVLMDILSRQKPLPYYRNVIDSWSSILQVPGARNKRSVLSVLGRIHARKQRALGFPGNDELAGITDPPCVQDPKYLTRWVGCIGGKVVELACHPGKLDTTLLGRDATANDGLLERRVREYQLLAQPAFRDAVRRAGFALRPPSFVCSPDQRRIYAA